VKHASSALAGVALLAAASGFAAGWTVRGGPEVVVAPPPPALVAPADRAPQAPAPVAELPVPLALAPAEASSSPRAHPQAVPRIEAVPGAEPPPVPPKSQEELLGDVGFSAGAARDLKQRSDRFQQARRYLRDESEREVQAARLELARTQKKEIGEEAYGYMLWSADIPNRIVVDEVLPESNASRLGLQSGDVVVRYGGERVFEREELRFLVLEPSDRTLVDLEILRDGKPVELAAPPGLLGVSVRSTFDPPREEPPRRTRGRARVVPDAPRP
jgi:hypothetical protein